MSSEAVLALIEGDEAAGPQVFLRTHVTPPGAPWDQSRAADLEAMNGAPLSLDLITMSTRRIDNWRPGQPGRFATAYVRSSEVGEALAVTRALGGRMLTFRFEPPAVREQRVRANMLSLGAAGLALVLVLWAVSAALGARARREADLQALEAQAERVEAEARGTAAQARDQALLDAEGLRGRTISAALEDLAWASRARAPAAKVASVRWKDGVFSVEAQGDKTPFVTVDRGVSASPGLRPGHTAWAVDRSQR
jgi:hypothetical protein